MICGLVVSKIYKHEFSTFLQNLSRICKIGITFAYELRWKSFLYEKSSTRKVTSKFNRGTPLNVFKIPKNLTEKNLQVFQDLERQKNSKKFKLTSGKLTSNRKNIVSNFIFGIFFQKTIRNMTGKFEIFFQNFIILMN